MHQAFFDPPVVQCIPQISTWAQRMFILDDTTNALEKVLRPAIVYIALIVFIRFFGKRELAQLNPLDLVVILSLSNTVQNAIIGADNSLSGGLLGAFALLSVNYASAWMKYRWKGVENLLEGAPVTLIKNGRIDEAAARSEMLTKEDLTVLAHREGFCELADVKECVLDPNGSFLVDGKTDDERQRDEILQHLKNLQSEMAQLRVALVKS